MDKPSPNGASPVPLGPSGVEALREALAYVEERDPLQASDEYDRIADAFCAQTRLWPPGRSMPAAMGGQSGEDRKKAGDAWRPFCNAWHERRTNEMRALLTAALASAEGNSPSLEVEALDALRDVLRESDRNTDAYARARAVLRRGGR